MCLILRAKVSKLLSLNLEKAEQMNPHGWGYGIELNTVYSFNIPFTLRESLGFENKDSIATLHFRWTTHGDTNLENAHPFYIGRDRYLYHNGIASDYCVNGSPCSDTNNLATELFDNPWSTVCKTLEGIRNSRFIVTSPKGFKAFHHWYNVSNILASNNQVFDIWTPKSKSKSVREYNPYGFAF